MPIFPANGDVELRVEDALLFDFEEEVEEEVLADEGDHDVPFNVAEVPQQLEAADGHRQEDVNVSLYENDGAYGQDHVDKFKASAVKAVRLSTLRYMQENKRAMSAIGLLRRRHRLEVDQEYVVDVHGANMVARVAPHYLDFLLYVGSRRGMDAALPNVDVDHTWGAKLQLNLGHRQWPGSHGGALGFDPKGRMMFIGKRMQEQLWIAMLPNEYLSGREGRRVREMEGSTRAVSTMHKYMLIMFLAYVLDEMRHEDISCITPYPEPLTLESVKESTEVLYIGEGGKGWICAFWVEKDLRDMDDDDRGWRRYASHMVERESRIFIHITNARNWNTADILTCINNSGRFDENNREIMLRLTDMRELHRHVMNSWEGWVNRAPASWKRDGFLMENSPVGVCMLYGQNQPIMVAAAMEEEKRNWDRDRNYGHISHVLFSLATHLSYLDVQEWEEIPIHVIEQNNRVLFDRPDTDGNRREVEVRELDLVDEEGFEINVYNEGGYRVPQRRPREFRTCGVMLDLEWVHELFKGQEEEGGEVREREKSIGDNELRETIGAAERGGMHGDDGRGDGGGRGRGDVEPATSSTKASDPRDWVPNLQFAITPGTERGEVPCSAAWDGDEHICGVRDPDCIRTATMKVSGAGQPQALRFENTYMVDVKRLGEEDRNGRRIYERVLCPLLKMWSHPSTMGVIKDVTQAFQPEMIPDLFKCGTYPITALIEMFWKKYGVEAGNQRMMDACTIEVMSMLERTLNYGHTGNAAVLTKRLMDRAWLSLGLINDGFPVLSDMFIAHGALQQGDIMVRRQSWPVEAETCRPMTSSKRSQQLTYGEAHYEVRALRPDAPPRWTRPLDAPFGRAFWTRPPYMDAPLTATDVLPIYGWTRPSQPLDALFGCASKTDVPFWTRPSQPLDALFGCASKTDAPFGRAPHSHWTRSLDMPLRWTRLFGHAPHSHGRALWMHSSQPRTRSLDVPFWTRPSQPLDALFGRAFLDTPLTATDALPYMDGRAPHSHWMRSLDTPLTATGRTLHSHWTRSLDALFTATDALFGCAPHSHGCTPIYGWTHSSQPWMRSHIWMDVPLTATGCALHSHRCTPIYGWTCSSDMQHSHSRTPIIKAAQFVEELCKGSVVTSK
ncbi:hypothetical protein BKA83DRAFT_4506125 [Pisolithus microcarpus]|nr:hypothetical protein BKA83DRAFT_4506125 [Pisolithus microcarpus]